MRCRLSCPFSDERSKQRHRDGIHKEREASGIQRQVWPMAWLGKPPRACDAGPSQRLYSRGDRSIPSSVVRRVSCAELSRGLGIDCGSEDLLIAVDRERLYCPCIAAPSDLRRVTKWVAKLFWRVPRISLRAPVSGIAAALMRARDQARVGHPHFRLQLVATGAATMFISVRGLCRPSFARTKEPGDRR